MNKYDNVLQMFADPENWREIFHTPFTQKGYAIATDAHIVVRIPVGVFGGVYEERDKPVNIDDVLKAVKPCEIDLSFSELSKIYEDIPEVEEREECDACDWQGRVEYEFEYNGCVYTHEDECPVCDGSGYLDKTGRMVKDPKARIQIGNALFSNKYIKMIIDTMRILESKSIRLVSNPRMGPNIFNLDDGIQILLMPVNDDN